jgi:hypothetical protein
LNIKNFATGFCEKYKRYTILFDDIPNRPRKRGIDSGRIFFIMGMKTEKKIRLICYIALLVALFLYASYLERDMLQEEQGAYELAVMEDGENE